MNDKDPENDRYLIEACLQKNIEAWSSLVKKAMEYDFSWEGSAKTYLGMYEKAKTKK